MHHTQGLEQHGRAAGGAANATRCFDWCAGSNGQECLPGMMLKSPAGQRMV